MQHTEHIYKMQGHLVILEVSRTILNEQNVVFTDGNATNQQLSQYQGEFVNIIPAATNIPCRRLYCPDGHPNGTNSNVSNFYLGVKLLEALNWYGINGGFIEDWDEHQRVRAAEVLVPDRLTLGKIQGIAVSTKEMVQNVNGLIAQYGLTGLVPFATCKPSSFVSKKR